MQKKKILTYVGIMMLLFAPMRLRAQLALSGKMRGDVADMVINEASKYIGTPYRWGGKTPKGFDCAGFTKFIYNKFGIELAPSAAPQYKAGRKLKTEEIERGDLVFYGGRTSSHSIGHVGIVTSVDDGGFSFIHAATTGIRIDRSSEPYYKKRFIGACRVKDRVVSNRQENINVSYTDCRAVSPLLPEYTQHYVWRKNY